MGNFFVYLGSINISCTASSLSTQPAPHFAHDAMLCVQSQEGKREKINYAGGKYIPCIAKAKAPCALSTRKDFVVSTIVLDLSTVWHKKTHTLCKVWAWSETASHTHIKRCEGNVCAVQDVLKFTFNYGSYPTKEMRAGSKERRVPQQAISQNKVQQAAAHKLKTYGEYLGDFAPIALAPFDLVLGPPSCRFYDLNLKHHLRYAGIPLFGTAWQVQLATN